MDPHQRNPGSVSIENRVSRYPSKDIGPKVLQHVSPEKALPYTVSA